MAGFVYWLFYHIMEALEKVDSSFVETRIQISSAIRYVWSKRHRPVLTVAYFTNPLLHAELSAESNIYELDESFADDVEEVFLCMTRKRFEGISRTDDDEAVDNNFIINFVVSLKAELTAYLKPGVLGDVAEREAEVLLASDFWQVSKVAQKFPKLAWVARRIHSMSVVTSKLERFFSHVGNVQTEKRASLKPERAALYAAAHQQTIDEKNAVSNDDIQIDLVALKDRCDSLKEDGNVFTFESTPGFDDLSSWLNRVIDTKVQLLYKNDSNAGEAEEPSDGDDAAFDDKEEALPDLIQEMDQEFSERHSTSRKSTRTKRKPKKLNL